MKTEEISSENENGNNTKGVLAFVFSEKGKDFEGNKLDENTLKSNVMVVWRNKRYMTGNRKNNLVELWKDGTFCKIVSTRYLRLVQTVECRTSKGLRSANLSNYTDQQAG